MMKYDFRAFQVYVQYITKHYIRSSALMSINVSYRARGMMVHETDTVIMMVDANENENEQKEADAETAATAGDIIVYVCFC